MKMDSVVLEKNSLTQSYTTKEPVNYNFHLLLLLLDEQMATTNDWLDFSKNSLIPCWATAHFFLNKNGSNIEIFNIHDLAHNENLLLPTSPKFEISFKNFTKLVMQWQKLFHENPQKIYLVIDNKKIVHLTTDLITINQATYIATLYKKFKNLFLFK